MEKRKQFKQSRKNHQQNVNKIPSPLQGLERAASDGKHKSTGLEDYHSHGSIEMLDLDPNGTKQN